jgi:hypothetical protein
MGWGQAPHNCNVSRAQAEGAEHDLQPAEQTDVSVPALAAL